MANLPGTSALTVSLPRGGGDVRGLGGNFVADYNRGTGSYTVDLLMPAGPAGLRPALALSYSSGAANGAFGLGWGVGVPSIHRDGERRFVRYDDSDGFRHDRHGELVRLDGAGEPAGAPQRYRPKYDEWFARIERGEHWEVFPREGGVQRYGVDGNARIAHPDHPERVLAWALQEVEDRNGNRVRYHYLADGNNRYLDEIAYGPYRVVFTYAPRPDVLGTARHGFPLATALRCIAIEVHCDRLAGASLIRRYALAYAEPQETPLSLLREIRLSGYRDGDTVALPPLTFDYTPFRPPASRCRALNNPNGFTLAPLGVRGTDLLDCTGDGLPDIVQIGGGQRCYWANRGDGSFDAPRQIRSLPAGVELGAPGTSFGDIDGDGAADLLVTDGPRTGYFPRIGPAAWGPFQAYPRAPNYDLRDPNNRLVDLDADGQVDLLRTTSTAFILHLNRGVQGWSSQPPIPRVRDLDAFPDISLADPRVQLADMTGDGLADIVLLRSGEVSYWPYEGIGRWGRRRVMRGSPPFARPNQPRGVFLSDVNGDGLADLVVVEADSVTIWINRCGNGFGAPIRLTNTPLTSGAEVRVADLLGAGTAGVLWSHAHEVRPHTRYFFLDLAGEQKPYLLSSVDNGLGRRTRIRYASSSQFAARDRAEGLPWQTFLPFPVQVVAEVQQEDPLAGLDTRLEVRYHDGMYDGRERRFAGFGRVELTEHGDDTAPTLHTVMRFDASPTEGLGSDARALAVARWGKLLETRQGPADGAPLRLATSVWTAAIAQHGADGTPVVTVHRTGNRNEAPGSDGTTVVTTHTYAFDEAGNVVSDQSSANGPTPLAQRSEITYARTPDGTVTPLPARILDSASDGSVLRERRYYYDGAPFAGLPLGQAGKGNLMRQSLRVLAANDFADHYGAAGLDAATLGFRLEDGAVWTDAGRYQYDAKGNLLTARDPLGHDTTLERDADGIFPLRMHNPAGHEVHFHWDDAALQPDRMTDANGAMWAFGFDALGRVTRLALPGDTLAAPSETVAWHLDATPPYVELEQKQAAGAPPARRRVYHDGGGAARQARAVIDDDTVLVSAPFTLNRRGWLGRQGEPSFGASLDFAPHAPLPAGESTTLHYDAIGRVIATDLPGARSTRALYDSFRTVLYDANDTDASPENIARGFFDTPTVRRLDGWGRLVGVTEMHDGLLTSHTYELDEAGRVLKVTGPDGARILSQRFDLAGNRLALDHRDAGLRRYYHDAAGRLACCVDAAGQRVDFGYDALDRPTRVSVGNATVQQFTYDDPARANAIGRLAAVHDEAGDWSFDYDARGRATQRTLTVPGRSWSLGHSYHPNGQLAAIRYPDGTETRYVYDRCARLSAIPGTLEAITYDARGRRTQLKVANGVRTLIDYDPQRRFLSRLQVIGAAGDTMHDVSYGRDSVGNLLSQLDGRPPGPDAPHSRRFTLDGRYRLTEVAGGGSPAVAAYVRRYGYDAGNNVLTFPTHGAAGIAYDPPGSSRIAGILDAAGNLVRLYAHDANGNVIRLPGRELRFDALGRLAGVQRADGATAAYLHNAAGERIWRTTTVAGAVRRTLTLAGLFEEDDDGTTRRFVRADGVPVAIDQAGTRTYLHGNELGHVTLLTNGVGALAGSRVFQPFGEDAGAALQAVPCAFGGQQLDEISGLYALGARHYAPEIGRFVSPDPLYLSAPELALASPRLFNPYAYAANNPMVYADPSGMSLLGSVLGGLVGGLVGAFVFVVSAGNPFLSGLAGGLVGGAVAGGIDGGAKGAVIGGLLGALSGALGGTAVWGVSALAGTLGGAVAQSTTLGILGLVSSSLTLGGAVGAGITGDNWDLMAGYAAGMLGAWLGGAIANRVMMAGFWNGDKVPGQVRDAHQMFSERARSRADISDTKYFMERVATGPGAFENHGTVTFVDKATYGRIGDDYLDFLDTYSHELGHAIQEKNIADFDAAWGASVQRYGVGGTNPFQIDADNAGRWLMHYSPYPLHAYSIAMAPAILTLAQPTIYDNRTKGDSFWRDFDRGER